MKATRGGMDGREKKKGGKTPQNSRVAKWLENGNMEYFQCGNMSGNKNLGSALLLSIDTTAKVVFSRIIFHFPHHPWTFSRKILRETRLQLSVNQLKAFKGGKKSHFMVTPKHRLLSQQLFTSRYLNPKAFPGKKKAFFFSSLKVESDTLKWRTNIP